MNGHDRDGEMPPLRESTGGDAGLSSKEQMRLSLLKLSDEVGLPRSGTLPAVPPAGWNLPRRAAQEQGGEPAPQLPRPADAGSPVGVQPGSGLSFWQGCALQCPEALWVVSQRRRSGEVTLQAPAAHGDPAAGSTPQSGEVANRHPDRERRAVRAVGVRDDAGGARLCRYEQITNP